MPDAGIELDMMSSRPSRQDNAVNFSACLCDAVGWPLGIAFFSTTTLVPLLMRRLGAGDLTIGALSSVYNLLLFLPGFLIVGTLRRMRRARGVLMGVAMLERMALVPLVWLTSAWAISHPGRLIAILFVCIGFHAAATGVNQPAYWAVVSKVIPVHWRGRLFGIAGAVAGVLGIGVDRILRVLLAGPAGGFPDGYARGFLIGLIILTVSVLPLGIVREPEQPATDVSDPHSGHYGRDSLRVWKTDRDFRRFLSSQALFQLSALAMPFFVLSAARQAHAGPLSIAGYTATLVLAGAFGNAVWGLWADRSGNRRVVLAASLFSLAAPAIAITAESPVAYYVVFASAALGAAGAGLAAVNITMEYARNTRDVPLYTTMYNAVTSVPRAVAPMIGGVMAALSRDYRPLFIAAAILTAVSLVLTYRTSDPRHGAGGETG